jgi:dihydroflavonol-4-reductase
MTDAAGPLPSHPGDGQPVLVTGGTGYLAGWVIQGLLDRGFAVRTTVRSHDRIQLVRSRLGDHRDTAAVSFHIADLAADAGWLDAADGCASVLHIASPMPVARYRGTDLVGPARDGTVRVLRASAAAGVRRVVLTSSVEAAQRSGDDGAVAPGDETIWTDLQGPGVKHYTRSKVLAERAAWAFVERAPQPISLTTILPAFMQGPVLDSDPTGSAEVVSRMLTGAVKALPRLGFSIVDVRDVADLHIAAMLSPAAAGERFIAAGEFLWMAEIAALLRDELGEDAAAVPTRTVPDWVVRTAALLNADARAVAPDLGRRREFSSLKARDVLGWRPRPVRDTIAEGAHSFLEMRRRTRSMPLT